MDDGDQPVVWRSSSQLAQAVRTARERMGLTQAQLAERARVGMKFMYELESGKDTLRTDKIFDVLDVLRLRLIVMPARKRVMHVNEERSQYKVNREPPDAPDYVAMACITAGISLRTALAADELIRALLRAEVPAARQAHLIVLLEEAPAELLQGLAAQVGAWASPGTVAKNIRLLARRLGVRRKDLP